ncbi:LacI family DNA-binding transcriptional regulator [Streptacidiphilus sp. P02-A3a]|uniref:LacI family DNA-binding transcriptional regulator n=1 Tax=Streptacidiphilus sp. P02-A3a TaxID=2704468 RepID=UPI0015FCAFF5|nr:LacI family DNA-binding transcriptional regulator [Streptacidiphilus sp. P02-A3a]QMU67421.1 LacI family transcriptional regulator [Streptacidiphilus sp. P02-A3a]
MARPRAAHVTVRAIAAEAGVSIATVSRVLNGRVQVAPETQELVRQAVERLGAPAPARRGSRDGAVYVRCPYVLSDYFGVIVTSIADTLDLHGRRMILGAGVSAQAAHVLPGLNQDPTIAGAVLILPPEPGAELQALRATGFPFVVVDPRTTLPPDIASVSAANFTGARSVTAHLTALGHRRIGVIGGPTEWLASEARAVGHTSALAETGALPDPRLRRSVEPSTEHGYRAACELLDLPDRPTALVGFNDKVAVGILRAAHERGLRVPEDLSVTGFDDSSLSHSTIPALTTVRQPLEEMGRLAVSLLTRLLEGHTVDTLHIELATQLLPRASTGAVPGPPEGGPAGSGPR